MVAGSAEPIAETYSEVSARDGEALAAVILRSVKEADASNSFDVAEQLALREEARRNPGKHVESFLARIKKNAAFLGYSTYLRVHDNAQELWQEGSIAAWLAIDTYNPAHGKTFANYVLMRIGYALKATIREECSYLTHVVKIEEPGVESDYPSYYTERYKALNQASRRDKYVTTNAIANLESSGGFDVQLAYRALAGKPDHLRVVHLHVVEGLGFAEIGRSRHLGRKTSREWPRVLYKEAIEMMRHALNGTSPAKKVRKKRRTSKELHESTSS